jgi:hypothetical protein
MRRTLLALILLLGVNFVFCQLGTISVRFFNEDPSTGQQVNGSLALGGSIQVLVSLSQPPSIPIRLDITSTVPNIVKSSHNTLVFNRGETQGTFTLESPSNGRIGSATILLSPETLGFYQPFSFMALVQGNATFEMSPDVTCVAANLTTRFILHLDPPATSNTQFQFTAFNGDFRGLAFNDGNDEVLVDFYGLAIGPSNISVSSEAYLPASISFNTLGQIFTDATDYELVEDQPENRLVKVFPVLTANQTVQVMTSAQNILVSPSDFVVGPTGTTVQLSPVGLGNAQVTYTATNYCPLVENYIIEELATCLPGSFPSEDGTDCLFCPGNSEQSGTNNTCNGHGICQFTTCFSESLTCVCESGHVGYACQWDTTTQTAQFDSAILNDQAFQLSLTLQYTRAPTEFSAPANLIASEYQPGVAIVGTSQGFDDLKPPFEVTGLEYTGNSFFWENTCIDNAYISDNFTAPVIVKIAPDMRLFSQKDLQQTQLKLWYRSQWIDASTACRGTGLNGTRSVDLYTNTLTASFCQPGYYAYFIVTVSAPPPNTGVTNAPHPRPGQLNFYPIPVSTGWQPAPPLPLPENVLYNPSLPQALQNIDNFFVSASGAGSLLVSLLVVCVLFFHL